MFRARDVQSRAGKGRVLGILIWFYAERLTTHQKRRSQTRHNDMHKCLGLGLGSPGCSVIVKGTEQVNTFCRGPAQQGTEARNQESHRHNTKTTANPSALAAPGTARPAATDHKGKGQQEERCSPGRNTGRTGGVLGFRTSHDGLLTFPQPRNNTTKVHYRLNQL